VNIPEINKQIAGFLVGLDYAQLPNLPNTFGINSQSTITFVVASGVSDEGGYCNLELRVSLACTNRTKSDGNEQSQFEFIAATEQIETNLEELIGIIISKFYKRSLKGTRPIDFKNFEISPPQSGKWRALILFTIPVQIESEYERELYPKEPTVKFIDRQYLPSDL
jgi:hypothetical protein